MDNLLILICIEKSAYWKRPNRSGALCRGESALHLFRDGCGGLDHLIRQPTQVCFMHLGRASYNADGGNCSSVGIKNRCADATDIDLFFLIVQCVAPLANRCQLLLQPT